MTARESIAVSLEYPKPEILAIGVNTLPVSRMFSALRLRWMMPRLQNRAHSQSGWLSTTIILRVWQMYSLRGNLHQGA